FQAEDGIRDKLVTGVQTCALPICSISISVHRESYLELMRWLLAPIGSFNIQGHPERSKSRQSNQILRSAQNDELISSALRGDTQIGRASCRERVEKSVATGSVTQK